MFPQIFQKHSNRKDLTFNLRLLLNPLRPATGGRVTQIFVAAVFFAKSRVIFSMKSQWRKEWLRFIFAKTSGCTVGSLHADLCICSIMLFKSPPARSYYILNARRVQPARAFSGQKRRPFSKSLSFPFQSRSSNLY